MIEFELCGYMFIKLSLNSEKLFEVSDFSILP